MESAFLAVIGDGPEDGDWAMAQDESLVQTLQESSGPVLVARCHGWSQPTMTLGRTQTVPPELIKQAASQRVVLARRPTGGGWLLHLPGDLSITLAVRGPLGPGDLRAAARTAALMISGGLEAAGLPALVFTGTGQPRSRAEVCFMRTDRDEVVSGETKVAGVALARFGNSALVQTAIPLVPAADRLDLFAQTWDPKRQAAAEKAQGLAPQTVWRGALAVLERRYGLPLREWTVPPAGAVRVRALVAEKSGDPRNSWLANPSPKG